MSTTPLFAGVPSESSFVPIRTTIPALTIIIIQLVLEASLFVRYGDRLPDSSFPFKPHNTSNRSSGRFDVAVHSVATLGVIFCSLVIQWLHRAHWRRGYLNFNRLTYLRRNCPPLVSAVVNSALVVIFASTFSLETIAIVITLETVVIVLCMISYLVTITRFNNEGQPPDSNTQMNTMLVPASPGREVAARLEDLDLIAFLRERVQILTSQMLKFENGPAHSRVILRDEDAKHMLEASDREIRLLRQETSSLKSRIAELQRAESQAKAERDKDVSEADSLRNQIRSLQQRITDLDVMLQVERDTNAKSQRIISQLSKDN